METLRIVTLNVWGGREFGPLMDFFRRYEDVVDVFCLQEAMDHPNSPRFEAHAGHEVRGDLLEEIIRALPGHRCAFAAHDDQPTWHSQAMCVSDRLIVGPACTATFDWDVSGRFKPRKLQRRAVAASGRSGVVVANFHGLWNAGPKTDTPERMAQSIWLRAELSDEADRGMPLVLAGDFNLNPDTEAFACIRRAGLRELVTESGITSTRTPLYRKHGIAGESQFADYMFVSPTLDVRDFRVLPDVVSDHAALYLEIALPEDDALCADHE
ncbi:MAG: hypothetical protein RLZZ324_1337 [Candidatus Parcubacteria bacterium]|jgi:endonuclease/exonuclease/phosphatase family metal-dependent hydrolase